MNYLRLFRENNDSDLLETIEDCFLEFIDKGEATVRKINPVNGYTPELNNGTKYDCIAEVSISGIETFSQAYDDDGCLFDDINEEIKYREKRNKEFGEEIKKLKRILLCKRRMDSILSDEYFSNYYSKEDIDQTNNQLMEYYIEVNKIRK